MAMLRSILAHAWAVLATPIVLATFVGLSFFSYSLTLGLGLEVSPRLTGGAVASEIPHDGFRTVVRRPVFDGLFGQRATGFVQVEWLPVPGLSLPATLEDQIDYDGDGRADFGVEMDTAASRATIVPYSPRVTGIDHVYQFEQARVIRVALRRE